MNSFNLKAKKFTRLDEIIAITHPSGQKCKITLKPYVNKDIEFKSAPCFEEINKALAYWSIK